MSQFTTFFVGESFFGLNILQVKEINNNMKFTYVPDSPNYIKGLLNLRGQVITIFDLAKRIGREPIVIGTLTRNLILKTDNETLLLREKGLINKEVGNDGIGFIVDRIGDVIEIDDNRISSTPANLTTIAKEFISGVVEMDNNLLILLNITELVNFNTK